MTLLSSLPSSAVETNEPEPMKRLSLAVARLDQLISRLSHLPHITYPSLSQANENQASSHPPTLVAVLKEDKE
jgi:hypothetical protein